MPVAVYLAASALGWPPAVQAPHTTSVVYSYWWTHRWGSEKGTRPPPPRSICESIKVWLVPPSLSPACPS